MAHVSTVFMLQEIYNIKRTVTGVHSVICVDIREVSKPYDYEYDYG